MQVLLAGLALGPGLLLVQGVTHWIGVVVLGDLGQLSLVQAPIVRLLLRPGLEFGLRPGGRAAAGGISHGNNFKTSDKKSLTQAL